MENEEIVYEELSALLAAMDQHFFELSQGKKPNVFSTDPDEDTFKIAQLIKALLVVLEMYEVPNAVA